MRRSKYAGAAVVFGRQKSIDKILYAIAATLVILASCTKEDAQPTAITEISASSGSETRAAVGSNGATINWESGDALKVFGLNGSSAAANADFTLESGGEGKPGGRFENLHSTIFTIQACMYPAQSEAVWGNNILTCNIPAVQTATKGSFDKSAAIMYSIGSSSAVVLSSAVSFLKVTIDNTKEINRNVHSITFSSPTSYLSGNVEISTSGVAVPADASGSVKSVTLVAGTDPDDVLADGTYYIAVKAGEVTNPSVSYVYIDAANHKAVVKTKDESGSYSLNPSYVTTIAMSDWTGATEHEAVQLWDDGPYWATTNVGAALPTDYGQYFAWGYTEGCVRNSANSTWVLASDGTTAKSFDIKDFPDREKDQYQDAAAACWGPCWCTPTDDQLRELIDENHYCSITYKEEGIIVTGNGNSIMLPCAGNGEYYKLYGEGGYGAYQSSVQYNSERSYALFLSVLNYSTMKDGPKHYGESVRPILSPSIMPILSE